MPGPPRRPTSGPCNWPPATAGWWYERDQLAKRTGEAVTDRLDRLDRTRAVVATRDDLSVEFAGLLMADGALDQALSVLEDRHFQPWEGGEGLALRAWERIQVGLTHRAMQAGNAAAAVAHAEAAINAPRTLGEARHELANPAQLQLLLGDALRSAGRLAEARTAWQAAAESVGDFQDMAPQPYSENTFYSVLACRRLGLQEHADELVDGLRVHVDRLAGTPASVDYFATSLPSLLLFTDDPQRQRDLQVAVLTTQLSYLTGSSATAAAQLTDLRHRDPASEAAVDLQRWISWDSGLDRVFVESTLSVISPPVRSAL